jgi:hypothetical protein
MQYITQLILHMLITYLPSIPGIVFVLFLIYLSLCHSLIYLIATPTEQLLRRFVSHTLSKVASSLWPHINDPHPWVGLLILEP